MAKTEGGKRTVAGVHWDYDGYGATLKKVGQGSRSVLVWFAQPVLLEGVAAWLAPHASLAALIAHTGPPDPNRSQLLGLPTFMPEADWAVDYDAGRKLIEHTGSRVFEAPIHIEGGSIHSDGEG